MNKFNTICILATGGSFFKRSFVKNLYLLLSGMMLSCSFVLGAGASQQTAPDIVFVRIPAAAEPASPTRNTALPRDRYVDGCQIARISLSGSPGKAVVLTSEFLSARDPEVSFNGREILFAGKRKKGEPWQVWRMDGSGGNKTQITRGNSDCVSPLFVGSIFHLNDKVPTRKILYRDGNHLYTCDLDGKTPRRITYNPYPEFSPHVLPNGRIVFSSFKSSPAGNGPGKTLDLLAVNIDGTDLMGYLTGQDVPGDKEMVRIAPDGRVYFIQSDLEKWLGGGSLACVSSRRPAHSYRLLAAAEKGYYHSPCPLPGGGLIVSYRRKEKGSLYSLFSVPPEAVEMPGTPAKKKSPLIGSPRRGALVAGGSDCHCVDAQVLAPRPVVKGRSSFVDHNGNTGVFYCISVYIGERPEVRRLAPGSVCQVRVLEGVSNDREQRVSRRILGTAPVETDGSFHIRVPAETPLAFQLLDKKGRVVCEQHSWTWVLPRESRGCIGCHEDRELAPPNQLPQAIIKPAVQLIRKNKPQQKKGEK